MLFVYDAVTREGRSVSDRLQADSLSEAAEALRAQGLTIMRLVSTRIADAPDGEPRAATRVSARDLVLFTKQMRMLLDAGAAIVPALSAVESQCGRAGLRRVLESVRQSVEGGASLSEALAEQPGVFKPVFRSIVAAGESTGALPEAFARLSNMTQRAYQVRKSVIAAMVYPLILSVLSLATAGVLLGFVVPRFGMLFKNLNAKLPATTALMIDLSAILRDWWLPAVCALAGGALSLVIAIRQPAVRQQVDLLILRTPLIGRLAARLALAQILRIWSALLNSHVPLLEAIQHSRQAMRNSRIIELLDQVKEVVASGGRMGKALAGNPLVDSTVVAAIATGEENGRLAESVEFVSAWLDEDNEQLIATTLRVLEPMLLSIIGLVVGAVAMGLFLPLFDIAAAGGI